MAIAAMQVIHMVRWWCGKYDYKLLCSNRFCQYSQPGDIKKSPSEGIRAFSQATTLTCVAVSALQLILVFFLVEMFSVTTSC